MDADTASAQPKVDAQQPAVESKDAPAEASGMEMAPKTEQAAAESAAKEEAPAADDAKPDEDAATESDAKKPADGDDAEMKDAPQTSTGAAETETTTVPVKAADDGEADAPVTPAADKNKARRKSTGGTDTKKKLNRKGSKANLVTHLDAKPGEYYFHQLKGHSSWPVVICDEEMLPEALLKTRPVSAARPDGTYREDHADGGKNVNGRKFPVMYLQTNEFGWALNTELRDLDPATVAEKANSKMTKALQFAHELAAEQFDLDHWKAELEEFAEKRRALDEAATASAKSTKKAKAFDPASDEDEDVEMGDDDEAPAKDKKSKKRKAEEAATPQRSDSVKKPKIKITSNSTPKATNGATPKSSKPSESKAAKSKSKKDGKGEDKKASKEAPKEPELSPEERHQRKEKEVLFLRHKLQKGLLTRDQEPKEDEMKLMSDYVTKLEGFKDLEVSIIRATKINKVLKGILKLSNIPKEAEFNFKSRSQALLDEWNKLLEGGDAAPAASATNGVNGKSPAASKAASPKEKADGPNGVAKGDPKEDAPKETESKEPAPSEETKEAPKKEETEPKTDAKADPPKESIEKPEASADVTTAAPEAVDAAA